VIDGLLRNSPPYSEQLAELVLCQYVRIYARIISRLCDAGGDRDDIEQELRIAIWRAWTRWDGRVSLRRWLSWKTRYCLKEYERTLAKGNRIRFVQLSEPGAGG
jgi:DNA-directed RNA polymerase specialized sigma24 family protein